MTHLEFLELCERLHKLGAVKVRAGELEAVWSPAAQQLPRPNADAVQLQKIRDAIKQRDREREIEAKQPEEERLLREFKRELDGGQA